MEYSKAVSIGSPIPVPCPGSEVLWSGPPRVDSPEHIPDDDNGDHPLLDEKSPAYSASVIQRAFISWAHLEKTNSFRDVCDYYHKLEKLESSFSVEQRMSSRCQEYSIISQAPPTSEYFLRNWGHVYGHKGPAADAPVRDRLAGIWAVPEEHQLAINGVETSEAKAGY